MRTGLIAVAAVASLVGGTGPASASYSSAVASGPGGTRIAALPGTREGAAPHATAAVNAARAAAAAALPASYIAGDGVRIRTGPGTNYRIVGLGYYGQRFVPYCFRTNPTMAGVWVWGQVNSGPIGYVHSSYLHIGNWNIVGLCG
ncbi:SH3 domain-containing protein [Amycolatopsis camponoti]|uniref:SH3 domain-containing protein n=1 Tax=Amycolatopsis camponoti TaxID=2606593 RepID=UPI0018C2EB83|nr:SH3 domain-containing protein [Amycolatopsis camponoti]